MKKILPVMIGAALAGGMTAASAEVTVFGHIDTSIVSWDDGTSGTGSSDINFVCTTCSIGFKGSEDLGNGMKAIFNLDFQYDTINRNKGNASDSLTDRDQWLGLSGGFGQVRIGTISTGYKSHGAMIDPLYRTVIQGRDVGLQSSSFHSGAGEELEGRADNTVRWDSKSFNGVKLVAHYTLDSDETDGEDDNPYGIGASYENGGILVFADYMDNAQSGTAGDSVWKIGGKYTMGDISVYGQYESEDYTSGDYDIWHVAGSYTMGANMIYVGYGQDSDQPTGGTDQDSDSFSIAATHSMSKSTTAYIGYAYNDPDGGSKEDAFAVGLKHKF